MRGIDGGNRGSLHGHMAAQVRECICNRLCRKRPRIDATKIPRAFKRQKFMMARRILLGGLVGGAVAMMGGCGGMSGASEVRYRVVVTIEGAGKQASGSGVWSWRLSRPDVALATPYDGKFAGESIVVDLPSGKTIYALLRGAGGDLDMASLLPERVFGDIGRSTRGEPLLHGGDRIADIREIASRQGERAEIPCQTQPGWCPMLVTFADIRDPASVRSFDPASAGMRAILEVEITDAAVSEGILVRLPWLPEYRNKMLDGSRIQRLGELPAQLTSIDFIKGT